MESIKINPCYTDELSAALDSMYLFSFSKTEMAEHGLDPESFTGRVVDKADLLFNEYRHLKYAFHVFEIKRNGMGRTIWKCWIYFYRNKEVMLNDIQQGFPYHYDGMDLDTITNNHFIHINLY